MDLNPEPFHEEGPAPGLLVASSAIRERERHKHLQRRAIQVLWILAGLILLAEIVLRMLGTRAEDYAAQNSSSLLALSAGGLFDALPAGAGRYGLRPSASLNSEGIEYRISSLGTRGEDFELKKPAHEKRLLLLGDGLAFGVGLHEPETLSEQLALAANLALQELGSEDRWRAINLGVPGYHLGQMLQALGERALDFDPDLIIVYFNLSQLSPLDFQLDSNGGLQRDALPLPKGLSSLLWKSHLYGAIASMHRRAIETGPGPAHLAAPVPHAWIHPEHQAAASETLQRMAALCQQRGVPFFVLDQALAFDLPPGAEQRSDPRAARWIEATPATAKDLDGLLDWCARRRVEHQILGYSLIQEELAACSSAADYPGLALSSESLRRAASAAFEQLGNEGLLP